MNNSTITTNKQRGVYSEIINPDNSLIYRDATITGPDESLYISTQQRQKIPKAVGLSKKPDISKNKLQEKRKTMEKLERITAKAAQDDDFDLRV